MNNDVIVDVVLENNVLENDSLLRRRRVNRRGNVLAIFRSNSYQIVKLIIQIGWFISGIVISSLEFYSSCKYNSQYLPLLITLNSLFGICSILNQIFINRNSNNWKIKLSSLVMFINKVLDLLIIFYVSFLFQSCSSINDIFIISYFLEEYIFSTLIIIFIVFIVKCGMRVLFPSFMIRAIDNLPIRLGASDDELSKILDYKFREGSLINSNTKIDIEEEDAKCSICLLEYENGEFVKIFECKHHFHKTCCENWLKINKTCPMCRRDIIF